MMPRRFSLTSSPVQNPGVVNEHISGMKQRLYRRASFKELSKKMSKASPLGAQRRVLRNHHVSKNLALQLIEIVAISEAKV